MSRVDFGGRLLLRKPLFYSVPWYLGSGPWTLVLGGNLKKRGAGIMVAFLGLVLGAVGERERSVSRTESSVYSKVRSIYVVPKASCKYSVGQVYGQIGR